MLDIIGLLIIGLAMLRGWGRGIIVGLCSLLGIVLGMLAALKLSGFVAGWMMEHGWVTSAWAQLISWIVIFVAVLLVVRLLAKAVASALRSLSLGIFDRLGGMALYAVLGAFVWSTILWLLNQAHLISPETIVKSKTYEWLAPFAPWVFDKLGDLLPFAKHIFEDLSQFFDRVNQNLSSHVGPH